MGVEENVALGREARAWVEEFGDRPAHFWSALAEAALARLPRATAAPAPTESERLARVRKVEAMTFPRGSHEGVPVREVPYDYIEWWLDDARSAFNRALVWYSQQPEFRRRQRHEPLSDVPEWMERSAEDATWD